MGHKGFGLNDAMPFASCSGSYDLTGIEALTCDLQPYIPKRG